MDGERTQIEYLQNRVTYLEEVNREFQASLDALRSLALLQKKIGNKHDLPLIFSESREKLFSLMGFSNIAFLLYDETALDFVPTYTYPTFLQEDIQREIDAHIESGTFAWALKQKRPVIVQPVSLPQNFEVVLHSLATDNRVFGMFIGQLATRRSTIHSESFDMLSIALMTTSLAIENALLYLEIEAHNRNLKQRVEERTATVLEINKKLKRQVRERRKAQKELSTQRMYFEALFTNAPVAVVSLDLEHRVVTANPHFEALFGYNAEEIKGKHIDQLIVAKDHVEEARRLTESAQAGRVTKMETTRKRKDDTPIETAISGSPVVVNGMKAGVLAIYEDITERKHAERELQKAMHAAESAARSKSEFLANMSHEIRTPLNAILGMGELVLETELTGEQREFLEIVQSSSEGLLSLINDILDFSKIEAGQMHLEHVPFNLKEVVESIADIFSVRAEINDLELICCIQTDLPEMVEGDPTRIRQVLVNLVGNAIKFTEKGEVLIQVDYEKSGAATGRYTFVIKDTGIGISAGQKENIFEKFSQADTSTTRKFGGTGLGLSISKSLVELMGGSIELESQVGEGCLFRVTLEMTAMPDDSAENDDAAFAGTSAIVVDAHAVRSKMLERLLKKWGCDAQVFSGSQILRSGKQGRNPDIVIIDYDLPGKNGVEIARLLKRKRRFTESKFLLMTSRSGREKRRIEGVEFDLYMSKPVKQAKLFQAMSDVLVKPAEEEPSISVIADAADTGISVKSKIVLLVEDNEDNQKLARKMLERGRYLVDIAASGKEAVDKVKSGDYDLILMDIQMPEMNGFEASVKIREIEKQQKRERTPIIALTAHAIHGYREKCYNYGMDDYMTKPIRRKVLMDTIDRWLTQEVSVVDRNVQMNTKY